MAPLPSTSPDSSLLHTERIAQYVSLSPASLNSPLPSLCASIFSPLLLSWFPPARGIVLAYEDVSLSSTPPASTLASAKAKSKSKKSKSRGAEVEQDATEENGSQGGELMLRHIDEYAMPFLWATATFLIWRPSRNAYISGRLTHASHTHLTLAHMNTFPVSVLAAQLPSGWSWRSSTAAGSVEGGGSKSAGKVKKGWDGRVADETGCWVDAEGQEVAMGTEMQIRIRDFEARVDGRGKGRGFVRIEGSLLSVEEESHIGLNGDRRSAVKGKRRAGVEEDAMVVD